jgi:hypothetical protein
MQTKLALTSFCKTAPAIGVETTGLIDPMAFISPVSEPKTEFNKLQSAYLRNSTAYVNV